MFGLEQVTVVVVTHHSAHCLAGLNALLQHCPRVIISDNASKSDFEISQSGLSKKANGVLTPAKARLLAAPKPKFKVCDNTWA